MNELFQSNLFSMSQLEHPETSLLTLRELNSIEFVVRKNHWTIKENPRVDSSPFNFFINLKLLLLYF